MTSKRNMTPGRRFQGQRTLFFRATKKLIPRLLFACGLTAIVGFACSGEDVGTTQDKIVGGTDADIREFPWQVSVAINFRSGDRHQCGGSIISSEWILTAAHCLVPYADWYAIRAGSSVLSQDGGQRRNVDTILFHPRWHEKTMQFDAALLHLETPLDLSKEGVAAIPLVPKTHLNAQGDAAGITSPGTMTTVTGWGTRHEGRRTPSDRLQKVNVPIVPHAEAESAYAGERIVTRANLAAGFIDHGGKDSCRGDSGGPLVVQDPNTKEHLLAGIVSFGHGCARPGFPGIYTRVSVLSTWISETIVKPLGTRCDSPIRIQPTDQTLTGRLQSASKQVGSCGGVGGQNIYEFTIAKRSQVSARLSDPNPGKRRSLRPTLHLRENACDISTELACSNPADGSSAEISAVLDPGTYYLFADSLGERTVRSRYFKLDVTFRGSNRPSKKAPEEPALGYVLHDFEGQQNGLGWTTLGDGGPSVDSFDNRSPYRGQGALRYTNSAMLESGGVLGELDPRPHLDEATRLRLWAKSEKGPGVFTVAFRDTDGETWEYDTRFDLNESYQEFQFEFRDSRFKKVSTDSTIASRRPNDTLDLHLDAKIAIVFFDANPNQPDETAYLIDDITVDQRPLGSNAQPGEQSGSLLAKLTDRKAGNQWVLENFPVSFGQPPVVIASMQTTIGVDPASVRIDRLSSERMLLKSEEENSTRDGIGHANESIAYLAHQAGPISNQSGRVIGEAGRVNVSHEDQAEHWHRVEFKKTYTNPVVIANLTSTENTEQAHIRVRNVGATSFEVMIEEWDYLDGIHPQEDVSYVVFEKGRHSLADGRALLVSTLSTNASSNGPSTMWARVSFAEPFSVAPIVFSQVHSYHGSAAVITRQQKITPTGFEVQMQEEKAADGRHAYEVIGYFVLQPQ